MASVSSTSRRSTKPATVVAVVEEPAESAKAAGLRYVTDAKPGIQRRKRGTGFAYLGTDGKPLRDKETLGRIKSLVIPPAWKDVWICPAPNGHLQATGRDVKGRKQSRYHPKWREIRDENKYGRMLLFGESLPTIRKQVDHDLGAPGLSRTKVLATIVRLMETTLIRVGNPEYARDNHSYGLTTMRNKHVAVEGSKITFTFQGKSRVHHSIGVSDRKLARIVKQCQEIPGFDLFQYLDSEGERHNITSEDVNEYLQSMTQQAFTAKDFRTWAGTVMACVMLKGFEPFGNATQAKKNVVQAIQSVAKRLGNTPSVCRKCYVHPDVLERYLDGALTSPVQRKDLEDEAETLAREERLLLEMLRAPVKA